MSKLNRVEFPLGTKEQVVGPNSLLLFLCSIMFKHVPLQGIMEGIQNPLHNLVSKLPLEIQAFLSMHKPSPHSDLIGISGGHLPSQSFSFSIHLPLQNQ